MGAYRNRTLFRDSVTGIWWKVCALLTVGALALVSLGGYSWLVGAIATGFVAWQTGHAGVWVGRDDILIVHPAWGRKRVALGDIDRFVVRPFNQWMIAWVITRAGEEIPCQGISSGRNRTQRVNIVVERLNEILRTRTVARGAGSPAAQL